MLKIGLTGGIGSGKSAVSKLFASLSTPIIDTDIIARETLIPGGEILKQIATKFGPKFVTKDGTLDRTALRQTVFSDSKKRHLLESILHPEIKREVLAEIQRINAPYCIIVIPLLIESGWSDLVDRVLLVDATIETQTQRVLARDKLTRTEITQIISTQASREHRLKIADDIICNETDLGHIKSEVIRLHAYYLALSSSDR